MEVHVKLVDDPIVQGQRLRDLAAQVPELFLHVPVDIWFERDVNFASDEDLQRFDVLVHVHLREFSLDHLSKFAELGHVVCRIEAFKELFLYAVGIAAIDFPATIFSLCVFDVLDDLCLEQEELDRLDAGGDFREALELAHLVEGLEPLEFQEVALREGDDAEVVTEVAKDALLDRVVETKPAWAEIGCRDDVGDAALDRPDEIAHVHLEGETDKFWRVLHAEVDRFFRDRWREDDFRAERFEQCLEGIYRRAHVRERDLHG